MKVSTIFALSLMLLASCAQSDKEPAELATEYTQIVTFTLDSISWTASSDGSMPVIDEVITVEVGEEEGKRTFLLTAWNVKNGSASSISLYTADAEEGKKISLDGKAGRASYTYSLKGNPGQAFLTSDSLHSGTMRISSIDTVLSRISGTFECRLGSYSIQNGTFDVMYSPPKAM